MLYLQHQKGTTETKLFRTIKNKTMKNENGIQEQNNSYCMIDSCGRRVEGSEIIASNLNEAIKTMKSNGMFAKYYYGKVKRCYTGGVRG